MITSRVYARIVCDKWSSVYVWFDNVDLSLKVTRQSINQLWSKKINGRRCNAAVA